MVIESTGEFGTKISNEIFPKEPIKCNVYEKNSWSCTKGGYNNCMIYQGLLIEAQK